MNKKIIVANWKTYIDSQKQAEDIFKSLENKNYKNLDIIICPPFPYLLKAKGYKLKTEIGAQNVFYEQSGHYTGEVTPKILKDLGVEYVLIGHSERRALGETDEIINKKMKAALNAGLKPILCVGEPNRESGIRNKELGIRRAKNYVGNQLEKDLRGIHNSKFLIHNSLVIAYEPIWAIGTGTPDKPEDSLEVIKFIKSFLNSKFLIHNSRVLYGGSVTSKNIVSFLQHREIDGALIGAASADKKEFLKILKIAFSIAN